MTHLAHKAEHAIVERRAGRRAAGRGRGRHDDDQVEAAHAAPEDAESLRSWRTYHSNETMVDLAAVGLRSYISEPNRGRRDWSDASDAQAPVYGNRRRLRGARGRCLRRRRAELAERSFAHLYSHASRILKRRFIVQLGARSVSASASRGACTHERFHRRVGAPRNLGGR